MGGHLEDASYAVRARLLVLWAAAIFFFGSLVCHKLEKLEDELRERVRRGTGGGLTDSQLGAYDAPLASGAADQSKGDGDGRPAGSGRWELALIEFSNTIQDVLGFVAGSAANDALVLFVSSLDSAPSWPTIAVNVATSAALLAFSVGLFIGLGDTGSADGRDRDKVERLFIGWALSFCVGWTWYITVRQTITFFGEVRAPGYEIPAPSVSQWRPPCPLALP